MVCHTSSTVNFGNNVGHPCTVHVFFSKHLCSCCQCLHRIFSKSCVKFNEHLLVVPSWIHHKVTTYHIRDPKETNVKYQFVKVILKLCCHYHVMLHCANNLLFRWNLQFQIIWIPSCKMACAVDKIYEKLKTCKHL